MDDKTLASKETAVLTMLDIMGKDISPLPSMRIEKKDWGWFNRNLGINHGKHPLFSTASSLIIDIIREKRLRRLENG